jgi:hypothetical protein
MTLRDVFREFVIYKQRQEDAHDRDIALAWHIAALERYDKTKPLPKLKSLLSGARKPQTRREQRGVLEQLSRQLGVPLQKVRLHHIGSA